MKIDGPLNGQELPERANLLLHHKATNDFKSIRTCQVLRYPLNRECYFCICVSLSNTKKSSYHCWFSKSRVSKLRPGDLLVKVNTTNQAEQLLSLKMLSNILVTISPHANLNFSRGVISESDSYNVPEQEILEGLREQKVCEVRRITIRRDVDRLLIPNI
ncbi:hypothetical protein TNCT_690361 [Trichonephila clavata]|uniref:Uncharacterized protein n=1 Tax=Trichonephila clavata TaxID=2740835 RepID=A0A8X6H2J4_TRICU|nr:hypothetical protein TNCT_690361 [Trichonephila clavata]